MNLETAGQFIERFGFPVFVALISLVIIWQLLRYFATAITRKDAELLLYIETQNIRFDKIAENHNIAFCDNTKALNKLSNSIDKQTTVSKARTKVMEKLDSHLEKSES